MRERAGEEDWRTGGGEPEVKWGAGDMLFKRRVGDESLELYIISRCKKEQIKQIIRQKQGTVAQYFHAQDR